MSRPRFSFAMCWLVAALSALAAASACEASFDGTNPAADAGRDDDGASSFDANYLDAAAATSADATTFIGNPLCQQTSASCNPDIGREDGGARACDWLPNPNGPDDDAGDIPRACRLERTNDGSVKPTCDEATKGATDGLSCTSGNQCAPGYDCVEGTSGTSSGAVCRHYCCADTCAGVTLTNGDSTFCDVQKLVDSNRKAPVCLPLKPCTLLAENECDPSETCAVVTEGGDTGCVEAGEAQAGASCDEVHCGHDLTCVGVSGSRKCYRLCKIGSTTCSTSAGPDQTCKTNVIFKDSSYGICSPP